MAQPAPVITDDTDTHDCLDHVDGTGRCTECGEQLPMGDLECTWCSRFPCGCDDAYERYRERELDR